MLARVDNCQVGLCQSWHAQQVPRSEDGRATLIRSPYVRTRPSRMAWCVVGFCINIHLRMCPIAECALGLFISSVSNSMFMWLTCQHRSMRYTSRFAAADDRHID